MTCVICVLSVGMKAAMELGSILFAVKLAHYHSNVPSFVEFPQLQQ